MQESSRQDWVRTLACSAHRTVFRQCYQLWRGDVICPLPTSCGFLLFVFVLAQRREVHGGGGEREELTTQWLTLAEALKCPVPAPDQSWEKCPLPAPRYTTTFAAAEPTLDLVQGFSGPSHLHASDWLGTFFHFRLFF